MCLIPSNDAVKLGTDANHNLIGISEPKLLAISGFELIRVVIQAEIDSNHVKKIGPHIQMGPNFTKICILLMQLVQLHRTMITYNKKGKPA